ncbi:thioredoxin family protein [Aeromicrobium sp. YIM 150415]|uniref:Thioredoxin family protein n=1 Tax=Aeromicrobium piscarium TaxID=2590901 RepID=A0A554RU87_9ACTN|nr:MULTISPECIES: thioredoxin family protein [Aeromicrobium]MBM9464761.1 thioredoxin family protein [Aeromicrobium sp. YIM 150415]TSD57671.1 thioredoxin family protein [Aeromicrobium piscarium]
MTGWWVLMAALIATFLVAFAARAVNGRFRSTGSDGVPAIDDVADRFDVEVLGRSLGDRATLVQFSSAFCQPCRATRAVLAQVTEIVPGVEVVEVDAEAHLELVRQWNVLRTPTVFVLDSSGRLVRRASGAPSRDQVLAAVAEAVD